MNWNGRGCDCIYNSIILVSKILKFSLNEKRYAPSLSRNFWWSRQESKSNSLSHLKHMNTNSLMLSVIRKRWIQKNSWHRTRMWIIWYLSAIRRWNPLILFLVTHLVLMFLSLLVLTLNRIKVKLFIIKVRLAIPQTVF